MKKTSLLAAAFFCLLLGAAAPDSSWSIVVPDRGTPAERHFDKMAAQLLRRGLAHLTGADLPVVTGKKTTPRAIFVGRLADPKELPAGFWRGRLRVAENGDWYFAGSYRADILWKEHLNHRFHELGTLRAVIMFLREYAGLRCPLPSGRYLKFTRKGAVDLPPGFVKSYVPDFLYVSGRPTNDAVYDISNGFLSGPWYFTYGGHSHPVAVPLSVYDKHPEYFLLTSQKKRWKGKQYCISNPGFQELVYREMCKKADLGYEWVQLGQTDGFSMCACDACKGWGNTTDPGEKIWILHLKLAERFHKERPGKKVVILCYAPNSAPPSSFKKFPPNVVIELCRNSEADLRAWKGYEVPGGFTAYIYNWGTYHPEGFSPSHTPEQSARQLKLFREFGVKGIYRCGFGELWGLAGADCYAYGRILADGSCTPDAAVEEFCRLVLPQAPEKLRDFYRLLYGLQTRRLAQSHQDYHNIHGNRMPGRYANMETYALRYDEKALADLDALLKQLEAAAPGDSFARLLRTEFDFLRLTARMSRDYLAFLKKPSVETLRKVSESVKARDGFIDALPRHKKIAAYQAGLPLFANTPVAELRWGGAWKGKFLYPLCFPFERMLKEKIIPGTREIRADGKKHPLLPALMEAWTDDVSVSVTAAEKGMYVCFHRDRVGKPGTGDWFYIFLPKWFIVFRPGYRTQGAFIYPRLENVSPMQPKKYGQGRREKELTAADTGKGQERSTLFIPWKYLGGRPAPGSRIPVNFSFRRQLVNRSFCGMVFEPDLKYLHERFTVDEGRGSLTF